MEQTFALSLSKGRVDMAARAFDLYDIGSCIPWPIYAIMNKSSLGALGVG